MTAQQEYGVTRDPLTDAAGVTHAPAGRAARIVSLVPSITELLFDLGLEGNLAGRTAFCVHPAERVKRIKIVGGTKTVKLDKLFAVEPTHVIVNVDETPRELAEAIAAEGARVIVTHPIEAGDNLDLYRLIGGVFGRAEAAGELCAQFKAAHGRVAVAAATLPRRRVLYLIWRDPWMTVSRDTYISRTLGLVNWRTAGHNDAERYPVVDMDEELLGACDLVLFSSEPFVFTGEHVEEFGAAFPAHAAKARLIDAEMVSWYGSRAIAGLDYLRCLAVE
jgi:ABC-type Fe3+-hydroxamate transport system substrate-binding protein